MPYTLIAYVPQGEDFILPQSEDIEKAVQELMKYALNDTLLNDKNFRMA